MKTITKLIILAVLLLQAEFLKAQDENVSGANKVKIEVLKKQKERIQNEERDLLKAEIEGINARLEKGEISQAEADHLKKTVAEKRAANIENRLAIVDNKIALLERNRTEDTVLDDDEPGFTISIGGSDDNDNFLHISTARNKVRKYDRRTTTDLVFGIGFNNALIDGESLDDSPYKKGGSGFVELGWAWKTRLLKESNAVRFKYGLSFIWNKLDIKDNQYLVRDGDAIMLEQFPFNLKKAKFRTSQLVVPVHFEFGPSKKIDKETYFRYSTHRQFKVGVGGYAGLTLATLQKLKFEENGRDVKDKIKGGYNATDFVYGLSAYVGIDDVSLYVKYDLSPIFRNQMVEQNNVSLGLRFDLD